MQFFYNDYIISLTMKFPFIWVIMQNTIIIN